MFHAAFNMLRTLCALLLAVSAYGQQSCRTGIQDCRDDQVCAYVSMMGFQCVNDPYARPMATLDPESLWMIAGRPHLPQPALEEFKQEILEHLEDEFEAMGLDINTFS